MRRLGIFVFMIILGGVISSGVLGQEIKIGTLLDHTGALKDWGPHHQKAINLAVKQMADAGFSLELIHEDSGTAADIAKKAAEKLIQTNKVAAIVGSSSSGIIVPVAESVTSPHNILMITPGATSPFITVLPQDKDKDLLFRTCPSDALQGVVLAKLAASLYKTASVMYVNNPYGQGLADQFRRSFHNRGGTVYAMIPHGEEVAPSYAAELRKAYARVYLTKPFRSGKSDVLCVFSYPEHAKVYVKEALEVFKARKFLFCDGSKSEALAKAVGTENLEGQMGTAPGVAGGEAYLRFIADYQSRFGELATVPFIANAYDATAVIGLAAYGAKTAGIPVTSKSIRDQLRKVSNPPGVYIGPGQFGKAFDSLKKGEPINYEGASGSLDFDENGDVIAPIEVWRFSKGKIVTYRVEYQITEE